jgi:hypothetical protein
MRPPRIELSAAPEATPAIQAIGVVSHSVGIDGVLQIRFTKAEHDDEPVIRRYDGDGLTGR